MTLTRRLTLFFLATLAGVLVIFSVTLYLLADHHLTAQLDDRLAAATRTVASAAEIESDGVEWEPASRPLALAPGAFGDQLHWLVTTDEGRVIDQSAQDGVRELLTAADAGFKSGHRNPRRFDRDGRSWQVMRVRLVPEPPQSGPLKPGKHAALIITAAVPLDPIHATLRVLAAALVGLTLAVLGIALVVARRVCRRALAPVLHMAEAARLMGTTDQSERLPTPTNADELADLGQAFNGLLDRLGEAFERERRFAGEASHQLRTPLAAVIGQLEVALRKERDASEYRRVLDSVLTQAGRLRRVVEALLFLARHEADAILPGRERVDLVPWVLCRLIRWEGHARARDLMFEARKGESAWAIIHPDLFGELLDALLDNALKYSEPGMPVVVRVESDSAWVRVVVEDQGCGIAGDDLARLFQPFFRSEAVRKRGIPGSGLGLAVAARITKALGGSIQVESQPGRGSQFRIQLPKFDTSETPR